MKTDDSSGPGIGQGIPRYLATLLEGLKYRGELLSVEWREEKSRVSATLTISILAALSAAMTLASVNVLLLVVYWETHRVAVAVAFIVVYAVLAIVLALVARARVRSRNMPFSATLEELRKDRDRFISGG